MFLPSKSRSTWSIETLLAMTCVCVYLCLNIGLTAAAWSKIPYSIDYAQNPYKKALIRPIVPPAVALPAVSSVSVPVPSVIPLVSEASASNPSKLLSRSGYVGGDDNPIYVVKRARFRPPYSTYSRHGLDPVRGHGRWGLGSFGGGGSSSSGHGGDGDGGHGHGSSGVFMLGGGGNRRRHQEPERINVYDRDQGGYGGGGGGYGGGGWSPPKKTHSSQYLAVPQHEKPGFVQKLIPIFPLRSKGKFSEIISWFSDPHGHRHGFNQHHDSHGHGHGHGGGWHK